MNSVGEIISWKIGVTIPRVRLMSVLQTSPFHSVRLTRRASSTILRRVLREYVAKEQIKLLGQDGDEVTYAIIDSESNVLTRDWHAKKRFSITINQKTHTMSQSGISPKSPVLTHILEAFNEHRDIVTPEDISRVLKNIVWNQCDGLFLNRVGGVYYVHSGYREKVDVLQSMINELGSNTDTTYLNRFFVCEQSSDLTISQLLESRVQYELNDSRRRLKVKFDVMDRRINTYTVIIEDLEKVKEMCYGYRQHCGLSVEGFCEKIDDQISIVTELREKVHATH